MKTMQITKGYEVLLDDEDYERLKCFKYQAREVEGRVSAQRMQSLGKGRGYENGPTIQMSHEVLGIVLGTLGDKMVDHINGNALDNRKSNLRIVCRGTNVANSKKARARKCGVQKRTDKNYSKPWRARTQHKGKRICLGHFKTEREAQNAVLIFKKEKGIIL